MNYLYDWFSEDDYHWSVNHTSDYQLAEWAEASQYFDNGLPLEGNLIATPDDWLDTALWIKSL